MQFQKIFWGEYDPYMIMYAYTFDIHVTPLVEILAMDLQLYSIFALTLQY